MPSNKLYVGNLSYSVTVEQLRQLFAQYGQVKSVNIIQGKGFGFVEMGTQAEAEQARNALSGTEFKGRDLRVEEARPPREDRGPRRDTRGGGGGGGGAGGRERRGGGGERRGGRRDDWSRDR